MDAPEPALVFEDLRRLRERRQPPEPGSAGCTLAIVAIIALVLMPFIGRALDLSGTVMGWTGLALALSALFAGGFGIFGGGLAGGAALPDVEVAIEEASRAFESGDGDACRAAVVRILDGAYVARGPKTVAAFDRAEVAERLGPALPYVEMIERILLERDEIDPVFTLPRT